MGFCWLTAWSDSDELEIIGWKKQHHPPWFTSPIFVFFLIDIDSPESQVGWVITNASLYKTFDFWVPTRHFLVMTMTMAGGTPWTWKIYTTLENKLNIEINMHKKTMSPLQKWIQEDFKTKTLLDISGRCFRTRHTENPWDPYISHGQVEATTWARWAMGTKNQQTTTTNIEDHRSSSAVKTQWTYNFCLYSSLVGGWTIPVEKYAHQNVNLLQGLGWNHHLGDRGQCHASGPQPGFVELPGFSHGQIASTSMEIGSIFRRSLQTTKRKEVIDTLFLWTLPPNLQNRYPSVTQPCKKTLPFSNYGDIDLELIFQSYWVNHRYPCANLSAFHEILVV